jgi:hypothetical protein
MEGLRIVCRRPEGPPGAFERLLASFAVEHRLGEAAIQCRVRSVAAVTASRIVEACIKRPGLQGGREGIGVGREWGEVSIDVQLLRVSSELM